MKIKNPRLSEEILRYSKTLPPTRKYPLSVFVSFIPYRRFTIVLGHPLTDNFYEYSKYGWWQYCAKKKKLDRWDEELLNAVSPRFGNQRAHAEHLWCKDNQQNIKYYRNLHPNDMVEDLKREIDIFIEEKDVAKKRAKMTRKDLEKVATKAKGFLEITIRQSKGRIKPVYLDKYKKIHKKSIGLMQGWLVKGQRHTYLLDNNKIIYYYEPGTNRHLRSICIEGTIRSQYLHDYDHVASKMLALLNDKKLKKTLHTIE